MTEEQLAAIKRRSALEHLVDAGVGVPTTSGRLEVAVEAAMNEEWWRGFYAGQKGMTVKPSDL